MLLVVVLAFYISLTVFVVKDHNKRATVAEKKVEKKVENARK